MKFILKNNLYAMAALGVAVAIYLAANWALMPVLQRRVGLFFIGRVMHLWEEGRFPGGFVELITERQGGIGRPRYSRQPPPVVALLQALYRHRFTGLLGRGEVEETTQASSAI